MSSESVTTIRSARPMNVSKSLIKSRKWAEYVFHYSVANGWDSFQIQSTYNGAIYTTEMPSSELYNGIHIYNGSFNKKLQSGIRITMRDALSLALSYKTTRPQMYSEWETLFEQEQK
jgi:hypothetical protein